MSLAKKIGRASILQITRKAWSGIVNFFVIAYLARELSSSDFGLVAISSLFISFVQTIGLSGFSDYIIYNKEDDNDEIINSVFWLNLIVTLFCSSILFIFAPIYANFYNNPEITNIVRLLTVSFTSGMLASIPITIFRKDLNFGTMVKIQAVFGTLTQISQVVFVLFGFGVYSLVIPNVIFTFFMATALFYAADLKLSIKSFGTYYWPRIFQYSKYVIGTRVLSKLVNDGDTLIVGRFIGIEALGIYDLAFKFANLINTQILPIITNITLPVLALKSEFIEITRERFLKSIELLTFIFIPIGGLIIVNSSELVNLLYGSRWSAAIIPLQFFAIQASFRALTSSSSGLYYVMGKPQYGLYFNLFFVPVFLFTVYFFSGYGLIVLSLVVTIVRITGGLINVLIATKLIDLSILIFIRKILPTVLLTSLIVVLILQIPVLFSNNYTSISFKGVLFVSCFALIHYVFKISSFKVFQSFLKSAFGK